MKRRYFAIIGLICVLLLGGKIFSTEIAQVEKGKTSDVKETTAPTKKITVPTKANQGDSVFIEVKTNQKLLNPYYTYRDKKIPLYKIKDDLYRGFLGISAIEKTGKHLISLKDDTGYLNDQSYLTVIRKKYPNQNIRVTGRNRGLKATAYELRQVQKAKDTRTGVYLAQIPPYDSPTKGCIASIYGLNRLYNWKYTGNYHKGVDIRAPKGQRINSMTNGKVIVADMFRLHGATVAVDHGHGLMSIYLHLSKINVKPGQIVSQGQKIGEVGSTGFATGPHLHWGLYLNGVPVDPMKYWIKPVPRC